MTRPALFALVLVLAPTLALAATHTVDQVGISFAPNDLTIEVGDTVEWVWSSGSHTVTSGVSGSGDAGDLFHSPLTAATPLFSFTFTETGDVPYHCVPHAGAGMIGIIRVDPATPVDEGTETTTFGRVKNLYR